MENRMEQMEAMTKNFAPHMDDLTLEELEEIVRRDERKYTPEEEAELLKGLEKKKAEQKPPVM